jgi:hypothetical protein
MIKNEMGIEEHNCTQTGSKSLFESAISIGYATCAVTVVVAVEVRNRKVPVWCMPNASQHESRLLISPVFVGKPLKFLTQTGSEREFFSNSEL